MIVAFLTPAALGEKVTVIVQDPPAATLVPQVVVRAKSAEFVPVTVMLVTVKAAFPVFFNVMAVPVLVVPICLTPNAMEAGVNVRLSNAPVPVRPTVCGLPVALSVIVTFAALDPEAVGANVTLIVHLALAAKLDPQLLV